MPWYEPTSLPDISLVIPVYRGGDALRGFLGQVEWFVELSPLNFELILVDDGADEITRAIIFEFAEARDSVKYIRHEKNMGKGRAVADGVAVASAPIVAFTDADLPYDLQALTRAYEELTADQRLHFVVGSRRHPASIIKHPYGFFRNVVSRIYNMIAHMILRNDATDVQCGMKIFRTDAARLLFSGIISDRFAFDTELFLRAAKYDLRFAEIPVVFSHENASTVRVIPSSLSMLKDLIRMYGVYHKRK